MPLLTKKRGGNIVIVNLQTTKQDKQAYLKINAYVDNVMLKLCSKLGITVPEWTRPVVVLQSKHKTSDNQFSSKLPNIVVDTALLSPAFHEFSEKLLHDETSNNHCENKSADKSDKTNSTVITDDQKDKSDIKLFANNYEVTIKNDIKPVISDAPDGKNILVYREKECADVLSASVTQEINYTGADYSVVKHESASNCGDRESGTVSREESRITCHDHQTEKVVCQTEAHHRSKVVDVPNALSDTEEPQSKVPKYETLP